MKTGINQHKLAVALTKREGGKVSCSVAQVKEILRLTLEALAEEAPSAVLALVEKHRRPVLVTMKPQMARASKCDVEEE